MASTFFTTTNTATTTEMRINGFDQIKALYSLVFEQKHAFKPQHISLYVFLINQNNRNMWVEWFKCPYDLAMAGACIGSKKTYYSCLNDLQDWGLLHYQKGSNEWKAPMIKLEVLKCTSTYTSSVPQSEPLPIPQGTPLPIPQGTPQPTPQGIPSIKHITSKEKRVKKTLMSEAKASDVSEGNQKYFEIALSFYQLFKINGDEKLKVNWTHLKKAKAEDCCNDIRLLIEVDKRTREELIKVFKFLQVDHFWMQNIRSTRKLREKFEELITKSTTNSNGRPSKLQERESAFIDEIERVAKGY